MYYLQIREFIKYFPDKSRYLIVDFEDIVSKPIELASRVFRWANLPDFTVEIPEPQNVTPPRSSIEQKLMSFSKVWDGILPNKLRKEGKRILRKIDRSAKRTLNKQERKKLRHWLQKDMNRFQKHFDFPVSKWGF